MGCKYIKIDIHQDELNVNKQYRVKVHCLFIRWERDQIAVLELRGTPNCLAKCLFVPTNGFCVLIRLKTVGSL
jgi:hypothetical protein